jgi:hypothetical protein
MAEAVLDKARASLDRIQKFDAEQLPREAQLGEDMNFKDAVGPALRIINLFRQYPIDFLQELPAEQLQLLANNADAFYNLLKQILEFNPRQSDPYNVRNNLIAQLGNTYQPYFSQLYPIIAYGATRQRDFAAMERDFRAAMQRSEDNATELMRELAAQNEDAQRILAEVRKVAAERGVSQQAEYFKNESDSHEAEALKWRNWTVWTACGLGAYAIVSAFVHKWEWLSPADTYQAFQLGLSKVLIFAVLAYMLLLCARNFLSHKHNAIVNKHRQNALLTFNALVQAAGTADRQDVILTYAAACIFSPQETGYTKAGAGSQSEMPLNIIQALPKLAAGSAHN